MRRCETSGEAIVPIRCLESGDEVEVRLPWAQRHHWITWGDRPRMRWGEDRWGIEVGRGPAGIRAVDQDGLEHLVEHGVYEVMRKAEGKLKEAKGKKYPPLKPGERWITVHPWGDENKGVPVLIRPEPDGTHRIIGGAGGKLTHQRLKNVAPDTPENRDQWKKKAKERKEAKKEKEKERVEKLSPEEREKEKASKEEIRKQERKVERKFIERVREEAGGVDEDLDEERLAKMETEGARNLLISQHHRKQYKQAMQRVKELARQKADQTLSETERRLQLESRINEDPELTEQVREMAHTELELQAQEEEEKRRAARLRRSRKAGGPGVGANAAEQADKVLTKMGMDPVSSLARKQKLDELEENKDALKPSDEVLRRSLEHLDRAQDLHTLKLKLKRDAIDEEEVERELVKLGMEDELDDIDEDSLGREAARLLRRYEIQRSMARKLADMEAEGKQAQAANALNFSDKLKLIAKDAKEARQMGLAEADQTPLQAPEIAAIADLLTDAEELRQAKAAFQDMMEDVEKGDYDASRRAFDLVIEAPPEQITQTEQEIAQTEITRRILGIADPAREAHIDAVYDGHYQTIADIGLSIGQTRYVDRPTVDAIGLKNAAILTRYGLEQDGHRPADVLDTLEEVHVEGLIPTSQKAINKAAEYVPEVAAVVKDVSSIEEAMAQLDIHDREMDAVQREIGGALGKMEALATTAQAYRDQMPENLTIEAHDQWDGSIKWLHAAGLEPGDYSLDRKSKTIEVPKSSWDKLMHRDSPETREIRREVAAIKAGERDEEGWLPPGIISRDPSTFNVQPPDQERYWEPLQIGDPSTYQQDVARHVGLRLADGEPPSTILRDITSPTAMQGVQDPDAYIEVVRELFPLHDEEGNPVPLEAHTDKFRELAEATIREQRPGEAALHSQTIDVGDKNVHEAVFRTLASNPRGKVAFTPLADLDSDGRRAVQDFFYEKMGLERGEGYQDRFEEAFKEAGLHDKPPMEDKQEGLFATPGGEQRVSKDYRNWQRKALELAKQYPSEGKALALEALGDEPEQKPGSLTEAQRQALDQAIQANPNTAHSYLVLKAKAAEAPDLTPEQEEEADRKASREVELRLQQYLEKNGSATQEDAEAAVFNERYNPETIRDYHLTKAKAALAPRMNADDVEGYVAPHFHRQAVEQVKGWSTGATAWSTFVTMHGDVSKAYESLQSEMRSEFAQKFRDNHHAVTGESLKIGVEEIPNRERHLVATGSREEQEAYRQARAEALSALQDRDALGRYASMAEGEVLEREQRELEQDKRAAAQQGGLLAGQPEAPGIEPGAGERWSLGRRLEGSLGALINNVGNQIDPTGEGASVFPGANMDGHRIHQQRSTKQFFANNGVLGCFGGVGFGKTVVMFGCATGAIERGMTKHGALFVVPSKVQAQFDSELLSFVEPGRYQWSTAENMSHEERVELLRNPSLDMRVMTHQSYMRTAGRLIAEHQGWDPSEVGSKLGNMDAHEAARIYREAMDANDIPPMMMGIDEAHMVTHRQSSKWGALHAIARAAFHPDNATGKLATTATPHKNDESEVWSIASLLDPVTYDDREKFMSSFGPGIAQNPDAIRKELSHLTYSAAIPPTGVHRHDLNNVRVVDGKKVCTAEPLKLHPKHQELVNSVDDAYKRALQARDRGEVDLEAIKQLSAPGKFDGVPEEEHEALARSLQRYLPIIRDSAMRRALELAPREINTKLQAMADVIEHDARNGEWHHKLSGETKKGKVSLCFADRAQAVDLIAEELEARGLRVAKITGSTTPDDLRKILRGLPKPHKSDDPPEYDVVVGTSAIEAGLNGQWAQVVHHFDVPMTEKSYNQRSGRAFRQGQVTDVENHSWYTDTQFDRAARLRLKQKTGLANAFQTNVPASDETGIAEAYYRRLQHQHQAVDVDGALAAKTDDAMKEAA